MTAPVIAGAVLVGGFAMAEKLTDKQVREFFDRHFPFVEQDEEPPGRRQEDGRSGRSWSGKLGWRTRHGTSIVRWDLGRPTFVSGAIVADGSVADVQYVGSWRYQISENPRRWVHGTVDIRRDGVTFTPGEQPKYVAPAVTSSPDLAFDLAGHSELRERLLDADFADALYAHLKDGVFRKGDSDRIWSVSMRRAAAIVADLRGQGDVYLDYYPHGGRFPLTEPRYTPEEVSYEAALTARFAEIKAILAGLGWLLATAEE